MATSFGLAATRLSPADPTAARVAGWRGIDLSQHRAKTIEDISLSDEDLVVVMEPRQGDQLASKYHGRGWQLTLLGIWSSPIHPYLHDPYALGTAYFGRCFDVVDAMVGNIITNIRVETSSDAEPKR